MDMKTCNLCGFPVLRLLPGPFGMRCIRCLSTFIHRGIGLVLQDMDFKNAIDVYELSSKGALSRYLRLRFPRLTFSEYYDDVKPGECRRGVQCQDVQSLTFDDGSFDLVTSTEVFEHVPDDVKGFREIFRVLRTDGYFVFTIPLSDAEKTLERACIRGGEVIHLHPPEYHGDRIRGMGKVLTFRDYGRDIGKKLESVGFSAHITVVHNVRHAIENAPVIVCRKK